MQFLRQDERVTESEADLLTLLRELDDPEWLEWPRRYNRSETTVLFGALVARLEDDFAARCTAEQDSQDPSEKGRVVVPAEATICGTRIVVCVSKFGSLALVCADNPGAFLGTEEAQAEGELDAADLAQAHRALADLGYAVVSEELLESDYDGPSRLAYCHAQHCCGRHGARHTFLPLTSASAFSVIGGGPAGRRIHREKDEMPSYDEYTKLRVAIDAGVAHVTLDNPPVNMLDTALINELHDFAGAVRGDEQVRVIVVQSADPDFFAAHVDLSFMLKPETFAELANPSAGTGGDESLLNPMQKLMLRFRTLPQVTIAKLAGRLRGGGNELAMALDMRFAAKGRTWLAQPETRMGIIPGGGGTQLLPPLVGRARALEVILSGNLFDAEVAERYGWINRALPPEGLDGFVDELARRVATLRPEQIAAAQGSGRSRIDQRRAPAGRARQGKQSARRGVPRSGRGGRAHARRRGGRRTDPRRRTRPGGFAGPRSSVGSRAC